MRRLIRRAADPLLEALALLLCYLVLSLCGWAHDHFLTPEDPAP